MRCDAGRTSECGAVHCAVLHRGIPVPAPAAEFRSAELISSPFIQYCAIHSQFHPIQSNRIASILCVCPCLFMCICRPRCSSSVSVLPQQPGHASRDTGTLVSSTAHVDQPLPLSAEQVPLLPKGHVGDQAALLHREARYHNAVAAVCPRPALRSFHRVVCDFSVADMCCAPIDSAHRQRPSTASIDSRTHTVNRFTQSFVHCASEDEGGHSISVSFSMQTSIELYHKRVRERAPTR